MQISPRAVLQGCWVHLYREADVAAFSYCYRRQIEACLGKVLKWRCYMFKQSSHHLLDYIGLLYVVKYMNIYEYAENSSRRGTLAGLEAIDMIQ